MWVSGSTHSSGSVGAPNCTSPLGDVGALALHVTLLLPKICFSLQSANPQATKKALHQVTCAHLSSGSLPAAPQTAVAPAGVQLLTASIRPGWRRQWWQDKFLALSGQLLIIALFHSSIFYPRYEFSCCFYTFEADSFFVSEVSLWFPGYHVIHPRVATFSTMSLLRQTLVRHLEVFLIFLSQQLLLSKPFCKGQAVQASTTTRIL